MDILVAILLVVLAWFVFKSLWAVLIAVVIVALVVWILRRTGVLPLK